MFPVSCKPGADIFFCSTSIVLIKLLPHGCFLLRGLAQRKRPEWEHWTQHLLNAWWLLTEGMSYNRTWLHSCRAPGYKWKKRIGWIGTFLTGFSESTIELSFRGQDDCLPTWPLYKPADPIEQLKIQRPAVPVLWLSVAVPPHPFWDQRFFPSLSFLWFAGLLTPWK